MPSLVGVFCLIKNRVISAVCGALKKENTIAGATVLISLETNWNFQNVTSDLFVRIDILFQIWVTFPLYDSFRHFVWDLISMEMDGQFRKFPLIFKSYVPAWNTAFYSCDSKCIWVGLSFFPVLITCICGEVPLLHSAKTFAHGRVRTCVKLSYLLIYTS